jgi:hypothetical protein
MNICKCTVDGCDFQKDGFCTTIPTISVEFHDVQTSDEVIGEPFPICQTMKTEKKEKAEIERRYIEYHERHIKKFLIS